ncbi:MAG: ATP-binding protein [Hyphomicrobiales bacterium]|nr:ATP-binding protein [Hyphomicrobiales bacterium]
MAPIEVADGRREWARFDHQPWRRTDGGIGGAIAFGGLLTETVENRRELENRNADLVRANEELEGFASIIAHDLSAPLRAIQYALDEARKSPQEAGDHTRRALAHARRMETMLSDLLDYCRVGGQRASFAEIDLVGLVGEIITSLPGADRFDIRVCGAPEVISAAIAPLDLALRNLLDNAIKHHDCGHGAITISVVNCADVWEITLADDGPGIDPAQHDAVFKLFQKTAASRETPGSGVGLAIVKKNHRSTRRRDFTRFQSRRPTRVDVLYFATEKPAK